MKRYVSITRFVIMLCVVMMILAGGCRDSHHEPTGPEPPSITMGETGIEAEGLTRDPARREIRATIHSEGRLRLVTIRRVVTTSLLPAMHAEIADEHGNFRYSIELASDPARGQVWFRERTPADVLEAWVTRTGGRVIEEYDINGDVLAVEHTVSDGATFERMMASDPSEERMNAAPSLREVAAKRAEFEAFCAPHVENTLHNNRDGELLMSLLSEPDFASFVTGQADGPQRVRDPLRRTCWAAFTCANLMCRIGGLSNPVCVACGGIASACIITEIACWFAGCDCCF